MLVDVVVIAMEIIAPRHHLRITHIVQYLQYTVGLEPIKEDVKKRLLPVPGIRHKNTTRTPLYLEGL